jgi:hypothetical protein
LHCLEVFLILFSLKQKVVVPLLHLCTSMLSGVAATFISLVLAILLYHLILVQGLRVIPSEVVLRVSDPLLEVIVVAVIAHVVLIVLRGQVVRVPVDGGAVGSTLEQHLVDEVLPIAELL